MKICRYDYTVELGIKEIYHLTVRMHTAKKIAVASFYPRSFWGTTALTIPLQTEVLKIERFQILNVLSEFEAAAYT